MQTPAALTIEHSLAIADVEQRETVLAELLVVIYNMQAKGFDVSHLEDRRDRVERQLRAARDYRDSIAGRCCGRDLGAATRDPYGAGASSSSSKTD